jgi:hypothetical protein
MLAYHDLNEEVKETHDLATDLGEVHGTSDADTLPVRSLENFTFYTVQTKRLCRVPCGIDPDVDRTLYGGSGIVRTVLVDDETLSESNEDEVLPVALSVIQDVWWDDE